MAQDADTSESQALRRTKRTIIVPERAKQEVAARAGKRAQHERYVTKQERKALAEARDESDDDSDGAVDQGSRKRRRFNDSLLMQPYDRITNDRDRNEWLLAAIYQRDGEDMRNSGLTREELEELYDENDDGKEAQAPVDHYPGIRIDPVEHPVAEGHGTGSQLRKLQSTDSTTIGLGNAIVYRGVREPNGKLAPIEGGDTEGNHNSSNDKGKGKVVSPIAPADRSASGSGSQVHGYANGFRLTPVPQPKRRGEFHPPAPQSALRLSTQSSQPTRDLQNPAPQHPSNGTSIVPSPGRAHPSTPAGTRTGVPAGSSRHARLSNNTPVVSSPSRTHSRPPASGSRVPRASLTPSRLSRPLDTHARGVSAPRQAEAPIANEAVHAPPPPGGDTDHDEEPDDGLEHDESGGNGPSFFDDDGDNASTQGLTKRQLARLCHFGLAKRLVQTMNKNIKLRAITECAYADIIPYLSEPDANGNRHEDGTILDHWLIEEWAIVNRQLRPGQEPLPLLEPYCTHVKEDFSGVRNHAKDVLKVLVPKSYGFEHGYSDENKVKSKKLLPDAFTSPDLKQPDPEKQFQHEIFVDGIRNCWFNTRKAVGFRHAAKFRPMPLPVFAFLCTIIHFLISDFSEGEQKLSNLDADDQAPWFERYMEALEDMGKPRNCPQRLENIQRRAFDGCHGAFNPTSRPKIQRAVLEYGPDSDEEYAYVS